MTLIPLQGHISFESAYIQTDYPYGRTLRCKRAVWIEKASKGAKKGQMRFVYRTTDPKRSGEVWNKPSAGGYYDFILLVYNDENEHVEHKCLTTRDSTDWFNEFHAAFYSFLTEDNRKEVDSIGYAIAAWDEIGKSIWIGDVDRKPPEHPENCIVADTRMLYRPDTGLHNFVLARLVGTGDAITLPVCSSIGYNEKDGSTYNLLNQRSLKEVEAEARNVAVMPDHLMSLEHFTQSVLKRFRTFDWTEQDGRSLPSLLDELQNASKDDRKAIRDQIKAICAAYHAELVARDGEIPEIREKVEPFEPRTVETMQWLELAFELAPHCPRIFNPLDIVDQDHGVNHRFVNPVPNVFGDDTKEVFRLLAEDDQRLIVNAPRPIPGEYCFESDFRHGVYYAIGTLREHGDDWDKLDAWDIFFVDNRAILRYIDKQVGRYGYASLAEYIADKFPEDSARALNLIKDMAHSKSLPWASRSEPEALLLIDAVNSGINRTDDLVSKFYGNEQYDYTEYEVSAHEIVQLAIDRYLLDGAVFGMQDDRIIPIPEEQPQDEPMTEPEIQEHEPDELEATKDEFGDGDFAIDHNQESAWSAETDDAIDDADDDSEDTEALYKSILLLSADSADKLLAPHVDRVMAEAHGRGILKEFRSWLLDHSMDIKAKRAVMDWHPEDDEPVKLTIVPPAPKVEPVPSPTPAVEPDVYVLKKAISEENADLILHLLQEHGLDDVVTELFEVKPTKKAVKGEVVVKVASPKRSSVRVQKGNPAEQAQKNVEDLSSYMQVYNLAMKVGPSEAARQLTAGGRKIGNTTVSQIKIAVKYLSHPQIKQWFDEGLITWSQVYAGRGGVSMVVKKLRAIVEKNKGA